MLRIVLGYKSARPLSEDPTVLYAGHSGSAAQAAIDAAPQSISFFERIEGALARRGKRTKAAEVVVEVVADPAPAETVDEIAEAPTLEKPKSKKQ